MERKDSNLKDQDVHEKARENGIGEQYKDPINTEQLQK